jgi:pilus assembly protein CpaF
MSLAERLGVAYAAPDEAQDAQSGVSSTQINQDISNVKELVHRQLVASLGQQLYGDQLDRRALEGAVFTAISSVLASQDIPVTTTERARIVQEITDEILGHGPLEPLLRDPEITEIMVNRFDTIYVEKQGVIMLSPLRFTNEDHLRRTIDRVVAEVGRRVDEASPMVDARLLDGSRVNAVIPPISVDGSSLTIRKFPEDPLTAKDLISTDTIPRDAMDLLEACVKGRLSILISGGTGSGKTTTLNVLSSFIPANERIITVEDAAELQLHQPHVLRLESRPSNTEGKGIITIRDLVRNTLRMRPDRIVVGEVRDAAALDMLQAMNTGHDGSISTIHANSPRDALSRIETMVLMADVNLPIRVIREQIASALHVIVHQARLRDGSRHVTTITEVIGLEGDTLVTQDLYSFTYDSDLPNGHLGKLLSTLIVPSFADFLAERGVRLPAGKAVNH